MSLTYESVDEILKCDHSNEGYRAVLFCGSFLVRHKVVPAFVPVNEILKCGHSKLTEQYLSIVFFFSLYKKVLSFDF